MKRLRHFLATYWFRLWGRYWCEAAEALVSWALMALLVPVLILLTAVCPIRALIDVCRGRLSRKCKTTGTWLHYNPRDKTWRGEIEL